MYLIDIGNFLLRDSGAMRILVTPNEAYTEAGPFWMSIMSASLVLRLPKTVRGNLGPGFCPYRPAHDLANFEKVLALISSKFQGNTNNFVSVIYPATLPSLTTSFPSHSSGYFASDSMETDIYFEVVKDAEGNLHKRKTTASNNPTLIAAIIIAVAIAVIIAIIALMLIIYCLSRIFLRFEVEYAHTREYAQALYNKGDLGY